MASVLLHINSLSLQSDEGFITKDISFDINRGEIIALTGRSGSGKTSIAMAILGLLPAAIRQTSGEITVYSGDVQYQLPKDLMNWASLRGTHIGFTQQDVYGAFDPVLRMGDQMKMVIAERSKGTIPDIENQIRVKMEEVGLVDIDRLWSSYPHQLSGGQLQRCQVCMAIVIQPELLITDEPTSAVDKINQAELLGVFAALRTKYNMAILCITHEEAVVKFLADREIKLNELDVEIHDQPLPVKKAGSATKPPIFEARNLIFSYRFGGLLSKEGAKVGPLDFAIRPGSCLGIIGESGSGKSTLAKLLVGLLAPESGTLLLDGDEIDFRKSKELRHLRSQVQLVMQDGRGSLHPNFTVGRILREAAEIRGDKRAEIEEGVLGALRAVNLSDQTVNRKPGTLSGGECLRVSIARALLLSPQILICDESTSALDSFTRDGIVVLLRRLMEERSLAIVFISHDEHLIREMSDFIMVMEKGKVVEQGQLADLTQRPIHEATKKIFGGYATFGDRSHP